MEIEYLVIDTEHALYPQVLNLRNEVLRIPLGMNLYDEDLTQDRDQYIVVALANDNELLACLQLKILDATTVKLRQMAVQPAVQNKGIGRNLVFYAENFCKLNEYYTIELHARKVAVGFYQSLGYNMDIDEFLEVGIPHYRMWKLLDK